MCTPAQGLNTTCIVAPKMLGVNTVWVLFRNQALCQRGAGNDVTGPGGSRLSSALQSEETVSNNKSFKSLQQGQC